MPSYYIATFREFHPFGTDPWQTPGQQKSGHLAQQLLQRIPCWFASSQWKTPLLCNNFSHWLGAHLESAPYSLYLIASLQSMHPWACNANKVTTKEAQWLPASFALNHYNRNVWTLHQVISDMHRARASENRVRSTEAQISKFPKSCLKM